MTMEQAKRFDEAATALGRELYQQIKYCSDKLKTEASEIRLRCGSPVAITTKNGQRFINSDVVLTSRELESAFLNICGHSVYSHQDDIANGFVTVRGGHRAGFCGKAVMENGHISALRNISSINLRIAHEYIGCSDLLFDQLFSDGICSVLIAGPPCCGKTTILRDIARSFSTGRAGMLRRVTVVDERGELAAMNGSQTLNDLGDCCDVLDGWSKPLGIRHAIRCLSPHIIVCDELGSEEDSEAAMLGAVSGAYLIASAHCSDKRALEHQPLAKRIVANGVFKKLAILNPKPGSGFEIYSI